MGGPDDAYRSTTVTFQNYTSAVLSRTDVHLDHGIWSDNLYPPESIGAGTVSAPTTVVFAAESQGFSTGDEGYATYQFQDGKTTIKVYFDNPAVGSNGYSVSLDGPLASSYAGSYSGGSGDNAYVTAELKSS